MLSQGDCAPILAKLQDDFGGPSCLYRVLLQRMRENPPFLRRSISVSRPALHRDADGIVMELQFSSLPRNGHLSIHTASKQAMESCYKVCFNGGVSLKASPYPNIIVNIPAPPSKFGPKCSHNILILLLSDESTKVDVHDQCVAMLCKVLATNAPADMRLPLHAMIVDFSLFAARTPAPSSAEYRSCMFPSSFSSQSGYFSRLLRSRFSAAEGKARLSAKTDGMPDIECKYKMTLKHSLKPRRCKRAGFLVRGGDGKLLPSLSGAVVYHCIAGENQPPAVWYERRLALTCVFCDQPFLPTAQRGAEDAGESSSSSGLQSPWRLLHHLLTHHHHFHYEQCLDNAGVLHILVRRRRRLSCPMLPLSPGSPLVMGTYSLPKAPETASHALSTRRESAQRKANFAIAGIDPAPCTSLQVPEGPRQYYHAITGQPVTNRDLQLYLYSAENLDHATPEVDLNMYQLRDNAKQLDEYVDISAPEKELMKLWNAHVQAFPPCGDTLLVLVCYRFVRKHGPQLVSKRLRHNWLLHLLVLWDFGLLTAEEVRWLVMEVDNVKNQADEQAGELQQPVT